jgi:hypothetical protein
MNEQVFNIMTPEFCKNTLKAIVTIHFFDFPLGGGKFTFFTSALNMMAYVLGRAQPNVDDISLGEFVNDLDAVGITIEVESERISFDLTKSWLDAKSEYITHPAFAGRSLALPQFFDVCRYSCLNFDFGQMPVISIGFDELKQGIGA